MRAQQKVPRILIALLAGFFLACEERPDRDPAGALNAPPEAEPISPGMMAALPAGADPELAREGRRHFLVCSVCHGMDGRGTALGPSLRSGEWIHIEGEMEEIENIIRTGVASPEEYPIPMPEMGGGDFTEEELDALTLYVYALSRSEG